MLRQTGKIMTKSSVITNRLSVTMAGLITNYLFSSDSPALGISNDYPQHMFSSRTKKNGKFWPYNFS